MDFYDIERMKRSPERGEIRLSAKNGYNVYCSSAEIFGARSYSNNMTRPEIVIQIIKG